MARPPARCSRRRNPPPIGKDEPAGLAPTEGSDTYTPAPAVSHALTPAPASALAPPLAPTLVNANTTVRYSEADL